MKNNKNYFLNQETTTFSTLQLQIQEVAEVLKKRLQLNTPIANTSNGLADLMKNTEKLTKESISFSDVIQKKLTPLLPYMIDVNHPFCAAHLHCPPLISSVSAEFLIASLNLSMDSWDQSGIATLIEQQVIDWMCQLLDYSLNGDGIFTSGGTQSNMMGILLAREAFAKQNHLKPFAQTGLSQQDQPLTILCTDRAHFSITQAARWLGIGSDHIVVIDAIQPEKTLKQLQPHQRPFVCVATAGCTDFGGIDPLQKIREICDKYQIWMHVDAAVGGALLLTKHKHRLSGIETADSVTIDFHKLFFQPISASTFIVKDKNSFDVLRFHSNYLNRQSDEMEGSINLVGKSLQTTRRFDALKIWLTWQHLGLKSLQQLIESLLDLTQVAAQLIGENSQLELIAPPSINTLVFRYKSNKHQNEINHTIRRRLFDDGFAVIGETVYEESVFLKFTLMNPETNKNDLQKLIQLIVKVGEELQQHFMQDVLV